MRNKIQAHPNVSLSLSAIFLGLLLGHATFWWGGFKLLMQMQRISYILRALWCFVRLRLGVVNKSLEDCCATLVPFLAIVNENHKKIQRLKHRRIENILMRWKLWLTFQLFPDVLFLIKINVYQERSFQVFCLGSQIRYLCQIRTLNFANRC